MNTHEDLSVIKKVAKLQCMTLKELDVVWRSMFEHAPEITSRKYMIGKIAYKIQEQVYGGLDAETENKIKACAKKNGSKPKKPADKRKFCPMIGTKIVKEYRDKIHEVVVVNDGFAHDCIVYKSLSAIATKIAGTKWNGLKFFGVK